MKRLAFGRIALALALVLPLASYVATADAPAAGRPETVVTEADNGAAVTLNPGSVLVVRLKENPSTGYSRAVVSFPNMPVRLISYQVLPKATSEDGVPIVGAPQMAEWRFVATGDTSVSRAVWLKLLNLRPFAKGVEGAGLWEVRVTVPPKAAG